MYRHTGRRRQWLALGAVVAVPMVFPAGAPAATAVGSDLAFNGSGAGVGPCSPLCTLIPTAVAGSTPVTSPITGVVVQWSASAADGSGQTSTIRFRVIHSPSADQWTGAGSSPLEHTSAAFTTATFDLKPGLPISAGDYVGVDTVKDGATFATVLRGSVPSSFVIFNSPLADNGPAQTETPTAGDEVYVQGIVEPDADRDHFGDQTQDQCPGVSGAVNGCPPPTNSAPTGGERAAALAKCKKRFKKALKKKRAHGALTPTVKQHLEKSLRKCKRRANQLPA